MIYPLDFPTSIGPAEITITAQNVNSTSTSPFTFKQQVLSFPGQRWSAEVTIPPCKADLAEQWVTFLIGLKGRVGTFTMGEPLNTSPRGTVTSALVKNSNQTGDTLVVDGGPSNEVGWFKAGDWFQLGSDNDPKLYKVLSDANTNFSGEATLDIWPNLRSSPSSNAPLVLNNPKGLFRLNSPSASWSINEINSYGIYFSCVEVL